MGGVGRLLRRVADVLSIHTIYDDGRIKVRIERCDEHGGLHNKLVVEDSWFVWEGTAKFFTGALGGGIELNHSSLERSKCSRVEIHLQHSR